jgi:hypothetical protein
MEGHGGIADFGFRIADFGLLINYFNWIFPQISQIYADFNLIFSVQLCASLDFLCVSSFI